MRLYLSFIFMCGLLACSSTKKMAPVEKAKPAASSRAVYRETYTMAMELIHTKLELSPNWKSHTMKGLAVISMRPHFYDQDSVVLNARGMEIYSVQLKSDGAFQNIPFSYDTSKITIRFGKRFTAKDTILVRIDYLAQPEKIIEEGSASIKSNRGLFFINPDGTHPRKPTQLWTQGETESNSGWFPTIESPQQKMTQEISMTVDDKYTTVSNGLLISSNKNADGTRTDYWKQSLPAAPYLTMIAIGTFAKVTEQWRGMEVSYYTDPDYERFAKMIFGHTPEMLEYFSTLLGVTYPWEKYAQIVVHDYISGAMENTTAVIHGTNMQQDSRQYIDYNFEDYISHELFHHWFGDLVTCESWSNLTLNEGFANYAEYLWNDYKFGRDEAEFRFKADMDSYFRRSEKNDPPLINYQYVHRENMYNSVTYNKGGRVFHMLRKYTGDKAFFAALKLFLLNHQFGSAELADLRMAFEQITGEDLNWFFTQWFFNTGFPELTIQRKWNEADKLCTVSISQTQDLAKYPLFKLPLYVDFYSGSSIVRKGIVMDKQSQDFIFHFDSKPDLVNVDAEKMLLCKKKNEQSTQEWIFQYFHAPLYTDRYEALKKLTENFNYGDSAMNVVLSALNDRHYYIREIAINEIGPVAKNDPEKVKNKLIELATIDSSSNTRETALYALSKYYTFTEMKSVYEKAIHDPSYAVEAAAFSIISEKDATLANQLAPVMEKDTGGAVYTVLSNWYKTDKSGRLPFFNLAMDLAKFSDRLTILRNFETYTANAEPKEVEKGIQLLSDRKKVEANKNVRTGYTKTISNILSKLQNRITTLDADIKMNRPGSKMELDELRSVYERNKSAE